VQVVGDVTQLDHLGHVFKLFACAAHVREGRFLAEEAQHSQIRELGPIGNI
jgi:hypothetical protein